MSREIDERVVEMQFDNQNFEKNVKTSLSTLDKLKEALNFRGVSNSFDELERASNKVDFSGMTSGVEKISSGFSALETIAVGALLRIGDQAVVAGEKLLKSLTVDQISAGWEKFGNKTTNVATLVAQGYDLDVVNEQLERLNWFTDETSYNFVDMVANIAKFTASGKGLEESVTAMEGIANWAALSGQNAGTASRAMYQLAQALGAGYMRLEDWKSIQNVSMDTDEFRQKALDAAVALGTLQKNMDGTYQSMVNRDADKFSKAQFAQHLTEDAWFTADVMMAVFSDYGGAIDQLYEYTEEHGVTASQAIDALSGSLDEFQVKAFKAAQEARTFSDAIDATKDAVSTGWMNTFELIFGNYEEAKTLWTDLANEMWEVFAASGEERNEILKLWKNRGGRNDLFSRGTERESTNYQAARKQTAILGEEFADLELAPQLEKEQGAFWNLWDALFKVNEESEKAIGVIAVLKQAFQDIFPPTTATQLKGITESIRDFTKALIPSEETAEKLRNTFKGVFAVFDILGQVVSAVWRIIVPILGGIGSVGDTILNLTSDTGEWLSNISKGLRENDTIFKTLEPLGKLIQNFSSIVTGGIGKAIDKVREWWGAAREYLGSFDWSGVQQGLITFGNTVNEHVGKAIDKLRSWKDAAKEYLDKIDWATIGQKAKDFFGNIGTNISNAIAKLKEWWAALSEKHDTSNFEGLLNLVKSVVTGAIGVSFVSFIRSLTGPIKDFKDGIKDLLDGLVGSLNSYKTENYADTMKEVAIAIGILAASLYVISKIDPDRILSSIGAISALFVDLAGTTKLMENVGGQKGISKATTMIGLATSIILLADAMRIISEINSDRLLSSTAAISAMIYEMAGAMTLLGRAKKGGAGALTMIGLAASVKILATVVEDVKDLSWEQIGKGLAVIAGALLSIAGATQLMPSGAKMIGTGLGLVAIGGALEIIADVIHKTATLDWEQIGKGLAVIAGSLVGISLAMAIMPSGGNMIGIGLGLIAVGAALELIANVIDKTSTLSWEQIGKGLTVIAGGLVGIGLATLLMPSGTTMVGLGIGMIAIGAALEIIANVVSKMALLSWEQIGKGLLVISGSLLAISIAMATMSSWKTLLGATSLVIVAGALLELALVMKTIGTMSWEDVAKGLVAIAGAFAVLGVSGAVLKPLVGTIIALSGALLLAGVGMTAFGAGLLAVSLAITTLSGSASVVGAVITSIVTSVAEAIPFVAQKVGEGIIAILKVIGDSYEQLVETVKVLILSTLEGVGSTIPEIVTILLDLIESVLSQLVEHANSIAGKLFDFVLEILHAINERLPELVHVVVEFISTLFSSIVTELEALDPEILLKALEGMGVVAALMTACWALSKIAPGAMIGLAEAAAFVVELAALIAVIGGLNQIPGFTWLVSEGGKVLETIGVAIGQFIGGIAGGIIEGAVSTLPVVGTKLAEFAENLKPFLETVKDIDDGMGEKIKILVAAILALTSAEITNGISSIFGGGNDFLTKFGEQLEGFAEHLVKFAKSISGDNQIDIDSVEIAMNALSMVADVASKLPNSGGLLGAIVGENDIGKFVEQLAGIGPILKDFSMDVQGINEKSIEKAMNALAKIAETAQKIPNTGGIWGGIIGENDIAPFVNQLAGIGPILKDFSIDVAGTNVKGIESAMDAIKTMAEAADKIPNTGGLAGFFAGENDLGDFIKQMKDVGPILTAFSYSVQGVDVAAISNAMDLVAVMSEFGHDELLHVGSFVSAIQTLSDEEFTTDLTAFGESISSFYDAIKGKVNEVEEILEKFGSMSSSLSSFISSMSQLGTDFTSAFSTSIDENKNGPVNSFAAILSDMLTKGNEKKRDFEILGIDLVQSFITGTDAQKQPSIDKYADILDWIAKYIESQNDDFKTLGETLAAKFGEGIKNKKRDVLSESNKICDAIVAAIKSYYNDTKDAGKYLMDGLIKGIGDKTEEVRQATKDISRAALNTMQMTLDEHSPSTITTDFGENFGQGFVNGIYRLIPIAEQASNRLAFSGLNAVSTAIGIISDEIGDDPIQPVISPVLDMSRLQNQKHLLADMFSGDTAVSVIDSLPVDRDGTIKIQNQNEQTSVVSELRSLRRDMGDMTSKMSRLQVVMDSGQLVGAISPQMDNAFGDISTRKGRWN